MNKHNELDSYVIPPNFIDSGAFFGGMLKARNAIEAGVLLLAVGIPVFALGVPLTTKIIILCLTALPLALFALVGIGGGGESLSSFALIFLHYLRNRRVVGLQREDNDAADRPVKRKTKPSPPSPQRYILRRITCGNAVIRSLYQTMKMNLRQMYSITCSAEAPAVKSRCQSESRKSWQSMWRLAGQRI